MCIPDMSYSKDIHSSLPHPLALTAFLSLLLQYSTEAEGKKNTHKINIYLFYMCVYVYIGMCVYI